MAKSNSENEDEYYNPKSVYYSNLKELENDGTEEERADAKKLKKERHENYKTIHKKKIENLNLKLDIENSELIQKKKKLLDKRKTEESFSIETNQTADNDEIDSNDAPRTSNKKHKTVYFFSNLLYDILIKINSLITNQ
jgi:hypothetical protein